MSKDLIIVESPAKVRTISKFLGKDYLVEASVGHIRDLPVKELGVAEENDFKPEYQTIKGKQKIVTQLKKAAAQADQVYLAPDPDREGEAIAWHIAEVIRGENKNLNRIQFNEITSRAVKEALEHPRELDENLFNSQQARRILDRLVGYKISPILWKKVKRGLSAGRVQSVALRLVVDRERERQAFDPEEYWVFKSLLCGSGGEFEAELWKVDNKKPAIGSEEQAEALHSEIKDAEFRVAEIQEKERKRQPKPPFITSTLQQEASSRLRFSAKRTMSTAQRLYEGVELGDRGTTALITYMRTDSVRVAREAQESAREWIKDKMGPDYCPPKIRNFKGKKSAQDAHEAIRPVDPTLTPEDIRSYLPGDQFKLYSLIWARFIASQMAAAVFWDTVVTVRAGKTLWRAKGERITFPGFLAVYKTQDAEKATQLPKLQEQEELELKELTKEQKFTQPPPRFSEASLVRKLEELGIGRPSTYATIISTIADRNYVQIEQRQFIPTELGCAVNDLLVSHFPHLMDAGFTANLENDLDTVAYGKKDWAELLREFATYLYPSLEKAKENMAEIKVGIETDIKCQECGRTMLIKFGRNGAFLACSGYPDCKYTSDFVRDEKGNIQAVERKEQELEKVGTCPKCGKDLVVKKARTGSRFIACTGYPDCKYTQSFSTGVKCPREGCSGELVERGSKKGKVFYGCSQYPDCTFALWDLPVNKKCPQCGFPILVQKNTKARGEHLACPEKGCNYREDGEEE
ncbi:MAG: type I DNA topoisomerase [Desulfonatronovibrionaceae bacterium]